MAAKQVESKEVIRLKADVQELKGAQEVQVLVLKRDAAQVEGALNEWFRYSWHPHVTTSGLDSTAIANHVSLDD